MYMKYLVRVFPGDNVNKYLKTTKCIILSKTKFKETSTILRAFSSSEGMINLIATGVFRKKNRFNSHLEPFSINSIEFYQKPESQLGNLRSADIDFYPEKLLKSTYTIEIAYKILKILNYQKHKTDTIMEIFNFAISSIIELNDLKNADKIYVKFLMNYLIVEGMINLELGNNISLKEQVNNLFKNKSNKENAGKLIANLEKRIFEYV